jgi:iron complex transport system permease protein
MTGFEASPGDTTAAAPPWMTASGVNPIAVSTDRRGGWLALFFAITIAAALAGLVIGPASVGVWSALQELADHIPGVSVDSGLSNIDKGIVWELRAPRVVLGLIVGGLLAIAGSGYQAVFRNPLADPYTLGSAAGAGLGATIVIVEGLPRGLIAPAAFIGAVIAVAIAVVVGQLADRQRSIATLLLAGVATSSFFTAIQTFVQQRGVDTLRDVYTWILGRLSRASWNEVGTVAPYGAAAVVALLVVMRQLDVLAVGDDEAGALGANPTRIRVVALAGATLATAAAVSVSGLIGFVGLIVPHLVRLIVGPSNRLVVPLSALAGGAFLCLCDVAARTVQAPAEIPIGVVTAFFGAPFFVLVLRSARSS